MLSHTDPETFSEGVAEIMSDIDGIGMSGCWPRAGLELVRDRACLVG